MRVSVLLIGVFVSLMSANDALSSELDVVFGAECRQGRQALLIRLRNASGADLEIPADNFPWHPGSLAVLLRAEQNGAALRKIRPLGHNDDLVTIKKGAEFVGEINLAQVFPGFLDALESDDVLVFVDYRPHSSYMKPLGFFEGVFTFRKRCFK